MEKELEDKLKEDFPELYRDHWHFECADGWEPLIRTLSKCIVHHDKYDKQDGKLEESTRMAQAKEKFGTLSFYYDRQPHSDHIRGLVTMAEAMSGRLCEVCGSPGKRASKNPRGWIQTLCLEHDPNNPLKKLVDSIIDEKEEP
jgi:hypothetical protein